MTIGPLGMYILQIFSPVLWLLYFSDGDCLLLYLFMMCYSAQFLSFFSLFSCSFEIIATFIVEGLLCYSSEYLIFGCLVHSEFISLLQLDSHM